jgi:mannose-1-phosphate guanylyltransferase/mannose-6-phosphate isomerase
MIPVILSGGSGSRLWPVSRQSFPKQFCELLDESLFAKTVRRMKPFGTPWVITVREMKTLTERALKEFALPLDQVIYEPSGRNTAPAIALLCRRFELMGLADKIVGVFPADQLVNNDSLFSESVKLAAKMAEGDQIVTIGIRPTYPATGYGYIATSNEIEKGALKAIGFREKPNEETARDFISRGTFLWNAGMFIFRISTMIENFKRFAPEVWAEMSKLKSDLSNLETIYENVRGVSIDYAVMERLSSHVTVPYNAEWSDLGSWDSIADVFKLADVKSPLKGAHAILADSKNCTVVSSTEKSYAFVGMHDLILIDTPDALLVTKRGHSERVKEVVDKIKVETKTRAVDHLFDVNEWGSSENVYRRPTFALDHYTIDVGSEAPMAGQKDRIEHWVFVNGSGLLKSRTGEESEIQPGQHLLLNRGDTYSIHNTGKDVLTAVRVQVEPQKL